MVVADLEELFVPAPDHLLSDLGDCREAVDHFLENLPSMFRSEDAPEDSCLGPALKAAFTIVKSIGGRMCIFQAAPPSLGEGAIRTGKEASHGRILGTPDESNLLKPEINWYRDTALEFSKAQIAVDMYMFPERHIDCASLVELPRLTAGTARSYPRFDSRIGSSDVESLESTVYRRLTQPTAFEAVLRIRCTKGMRISRFYGNFNIRGTDLLALPNCNADSVYGFELAHDDPNMAGAGDAGGGGGGLTSNSFVTIQSALLYTTNDGERRIRVSTQALRLSSRPAEVLASANESCVAALLAKQVMSQAMKSNLDVARNRLIQSCVDVVRCAKEAGMTSEGAGGEIVIPESLRLLPLYVLSLLKHAAVRGGTDINPDERVCARALLTDAFVSDTIRLIHPRMFAVHDLDRPDNVQVGLPIEMTIGEDGEEKVVENDDDGERSVAGRERIRLPRMVGLSVDSLSSEGIYVLDNGLETYVWVGRASYPASTMALFGVDSLEHANMMEIQLQTQGNDVATRLSTILQALHDGNEEQPGLPPISSKIIIVREGDMQMESRFFWNLVEDRAQFNGGTYTYPEFMQAVSQPGGGGGGMPPGGMPSGGMPPSGHGGGMMPPPGGNGMMPPPGGNGMMPPPGGNGMMPPPPPGGGRMAPPGPPGGGMQRGYAPPPPNNQPSYARGGPPPPGGGPPGYNAPPPGGPPPPISAGGGPPPPAPGGIGGPQPPQQFSGPPSGSNSGFGGMPPPPSVMDRSAPLPPAGGPPGPPSGGGYNAAPPSGGGGGYYNTAAPPSGGGGYNPSMSNASQPPSSVPPSSGGYNPSSAPPSSGGYNPPIGGQPPSSGSFSMPQGSGGGGGGRGPPPPPPSSGGYGGPSPPGPPPPNSGGYVPGPPPNSGGYNMQGGMAPPGGPPPPTSQMPPPPGQYYNR